jgi:hypothetical protein
MYRCAGGAKDNDSEQVLQLKAENRVSSPAAALSSPA